MRSELCDFSCQLVHETDKAVLLDFGGDKNEWFPKSQIELEKMRDGTYICTCPQYLAEEKGAV